MKKVWFKKGNSYECYVCKYPYNQKDIVNEGIKYEEWILLETLKEMKIWQQN